MKKYLLKLISIYQFLLSPDHSFWARGLNKTPYCKHIPSCSEYMKESIEKKGIIVGIGKGTWRIMRCNPWTQGGYDPVEKSDL